MTLSTKSNLGFRLGLALAVIALICLAVYLYFSWPKDADQDSAAIERRILPLDSIELDMSGSDQLVAQSTPEKIVETKCSACHITGAAGAPKLKNAQEWAPRIRLGLDTLQQSVINGKGAMPPKGGFTDLTDAQIREAIIVMANASGANFK